MTRISSTFRRSAAVLLLLAATSFLSSEAASELGASRWEGLYRSAEGEIMRIRSYGDIISLDIFTRQNGAWILTTAWATNMKKSDYAEFRQRAEPDGLWLSLSFKKDGALLETHEPDLPKNEQSFYSRLSVAESKLVTGLPE
jgi:hypothetical protein